VVAQVQEQPKIVQNEKQEDGASTTGVRGTIQDTITQNGKPLSGVVVTEKNESNTMLNGKERNPGGLIEGTAPTNKAGQINDQVGLMAPARAAEKEKALIQILNTQAVSVTNTNTIIFKTPGGATCSATATRVLTNVGLDGKVSSTYTLSTTQPTVTTVKK